jgi:putative membrane protein
MRTQLIFAFGAALLAAACSPRKPVPRAPVTTSATVPAPALTDAQIVAVTGTASSAEVEQGQLAVATATSPRVRAFAHHMIRAHSEMLKDQSQLEQRLRLTPEPNDTSSKLLHDATQTIDQLKNRSGPDFDRAYMASQVKEHKELLNTIDTRLLPNAHDPALRDALRDMRAKTKSHLDEAQDILGSILP